jgi:hypothetical protein
MAPIQSSCGEMLVLLRDSQLAKHRPDELIGQLEETNLNGSE